MKQIARVGMLLVGLLLGSAAQAGKVTYVYTDIQGTPVMESDAQGNITARFDYTPYGMPVQGLSGSPNGPGYTGHMNDPDTGFVYMQARYYDPGYAIFLSADPVPVAAGNIFNFVRYAYVSNNPVVLTDPTGRIQKHPQDSMCSDPFPCDNDPWVVVYPQSPFGSSLSPSEQRVVNPVPSRMIVVDSYHDADCWECHVVYRYRLVNTAGFPLTDADYKVQEHIKPLIRIGDPVVENTSEGTYQSLRDGFGIDTVGLTDQGYSALTKSSHSLDIYRQTFSVKHSGKESVLNTIFYHKIEIDGTKVSVNTKVVRP